MARQRSIWFKFALAGGTLAVIGVGCLAVLLALGSGKPTIAVDYAAKFNERAKAVPGEDRAWPVYREALLELHADRHEPEFSRLMYEAEPGSEDWTKLSALYDERQRTLATLRRAASMPGMGLVVTTQTAREFAEALGDDPPIEAPFDPGLTDVAGNLIPIFSEFRRSARMLNTDARVAIDAGEPSRFVDDVEALLGMSEHCNEVPTLINDFNAMGIRVLAFERVREAINDYPGTLDELHLVRLDSALRRLDDGGNFRLSLDGEHWQFLDTVQRQYTDDGRGGGRLSGFDPSLTHHTGAGTPSLLDRITIGFVGLYAMDRGEIEAEYNRRLEDLRAWSGIPLWERGSALEFIGFEETEYDEIFSMDLSLVLLMSFDVLPKAQLAADRVKFERVGTRTVIALERARLARGAWPESLDAIVPEYLERVPIDEFNGRPLTYLRTETGMTLYSIGMDREDDGGRAAPLARNWAAPGEAAELIRSEPDKYDGDLVFFPPPEFD